MAHFVANFIWTDKDEPGMMHSYDPHEFIGMVQGLCEIMRRGLIRDLIIDTEFGCDRPAHMRPSHEPDLDELDLGTLPG